jgi:hypothetical protein
MNACSIVIPIYHHDVLQLPLIWTVFSIFSWSIKAIMLGSAKTCCCPYTNWGCITLCILYSLLALAFMDSASALIYMNKLAGFDAWRVGVKGAGVYCLVRVLFSIEFRVNLYLREWFVEKTIYPVLILWENARITMLALHFTGHPYNHLRQWFYLPAKST